MSVRLRDRLHVIDKDHFPSRFGITGRSLAGILAIDCVLAHGFLPEPGCGYGFGVAGRADSDGGEVAEVRR